MFKLSSFKQKKAEKSKSIECEIYMGLVVSSFFDVENNPQQSFFNKHFSHPGKNLIFQSEIDLRANSYNDSGKQQCGRLKTETSRPHVAKSRTAFSN